MPNHRIKCSIAYLWLASCVPPQAPRDLEAKPRAAESRFLLKRLALAIPDDLDLASSLKTDAVLPRIAAPPFEVAGQSLDDQQHALQCLAAAVYYEARSETVDGQRAVAQVVLNRVRDRAFPNNVCGVVYQGAERKTGCQFTFTCDGSLARPLEERAWLRAKGIASAALNGFVYTPVAFATSYHAASILPWWAPSLVRIGLIGSHVFYGWNAQMERALSFRQRYGGNEETTASAPLKPEFEAKAFGVTIHRGGITSLVVNDFREGSTVHIHRGSGADPIMKPDHSRSISVGQSSAQT